MPCSFRDMLETLVPFPTFINFGRDVPLFASRWGCCVAMHRSDTEGRVVGILIILWWVLWTREWTFRYHKKRRKTWSPNHLITYSFTNLLPRYSCLRRLKQLLLSINSFNGFQFPLTERAGVALSLRVLESNIGRDDGCPDWCLSLFPSATPGKFWDSLYDRFSSSSSFICHYIIRHFVI
jgi:hypothetical protein